jgi:hypothetical protein
VLNAVQDKSAIFVSCFFFLLTFPVGSGIHCLVRQMAWTWVTIVGSIGSQGMQITEIMVLQDPLE